MSDSRMSMDVDLSGSDSDDAINNTAVTVSNAVCSVTVTATAADGARAGPSKKQASVAEVSPNPYPLPLNYDKLLIRMLVGENLLVEPLDGGMGHQHLLPRTGKGSKVSPCVQMKLARVEAEMARLAQEIQTLRGTEAKVKEASKLMGQEIQMLSKGMQAYGVLEGFMIKHKDKIVEALQEADQEILRQRGCIDSLNLD